MRNVIHKKNIMELVAQRDVWGYGLGCRDVGA